MSREVSERFPGRGGVRVVGEIGGVPVQTWLMPVGDGARCIGVHKATIERGGFSTGDTLRVIAEVDDAPREVVVPDDFAKALGRHRAAFDALFYTDRKEYVQSIVEAKKPETYFSAKAWTSGDASSSEIASRRALSWSVRRSEIGQARSGGELSAARPRAP